MNNPDYPSLSALNRSTPPPPKKNRRNVLLLVLALVAILFCCLIGIVALLYFDPFDWNIFNRGGDTVAKAAPPDSVAFAGINLQNISAVKLQPLISVFEEAFEDYFGESQDIADDLQDQINYSLEEYDLTIEDDILPWIGTQAGFGLIDLETDEYGYPEGANFYFAIEARDTNAADDFLEKLTGGIEDSWDVSIDTSTYQGTTIYIIDDPYDPWAFARHNTLVIMANSEDAIEQVIDAQEGDSLADDPVYRKTIGELPSDQVISFYLPGDAFSTLTEAAGGGMGLYPDVIQDTYDSLAGMAFSLAIVDEGLQMDVVVAYDPDNISDSQRELMEATGRSGNEAADQLPDDTLVYFSGARLDLAWASIYDTLDASMGGDFDEAMAELEDEIGFDLNDDLLANLDGAYAIAVFTSDSGVMAESAEIPLGFAFVAQTSDEGAMLNTLDDFNSFMEDYGGVDIDENSQGDMTLYEVREPYFDMTLFSYGVGGGWFGLATSIDVLEALPNPNNPLSESATFRQAQDYLPSGMNLVGFIDIKNGLAEMRDYLSDWDLDDFEETTFFLKPIESLVFGSSNYSNNMVHSTMLLVIPTDK